MDYIAPRESRMRPGCEIQIPCMFADYVDRAERLGPRLSCGQGVSLERKRLGGDGYEIPCCEGLIKRDGVLAGTSVILAMGRRWWSLPARLFLCAVPDIVHGAWLSGPPFDNLTGMFN